MFESQKKFITTLIIIALVLTALAYGLFYFFIPQHYFTYFPAIPACVLVITFLVHIYLIKSSENNTRKFTAKYLGAMGFKMFLYLLFLVIILLIDTSHAVPFLVSFLVTYATFTLYEVISILNFLKKDK